MASPAPKLNQIPSQNVRGVDETFYTIRKLESLSELEAKQSDTFLAAAFDKDEFTEVVTGGDRNIYGRFWRSLMVAGLYGGEVYVAEVNNTIIAAAVWYGPGRLLYDSDEQHDKAWTICTEVFRSEITEWWDTDFLPKYAEFGEATFGKSGKLASWHLQAFAVSPEFQRRGIAKALIKTMKDKASIEGTPLTLECTADYNVEIYKKLGFSVKGETRYTGISGGFPMWGMYQAVSKV